MGYTNAEIQKLEDLEEDELIIRDMFLASNSRKAQKAYIRLLNLIRRMRANT